MSNSTEQFEQQVRAMLHRHAADAPSAKDNPVSVPDLAQRSSSRRTASAAAAVGVAAVVGVTALVAQHDRPSAHSAGAGVASAAPVTPATLPFVLPPGRTLNSSPAHVVGSAGFDQPRLDAIAARLDAAGRSRFSSSYSAVALDEEHDRVLCYRTPSSAFDRYVLTEFRGQPVVLIDALFSKEQMDSTMNRIVRDMPYWRKEGIHVNSVGAIATGSGVNVTITEAITSAITAAFRNRYPSVAIQLTIGPPAKPLSGSYGGGGTGGLGGGARYSPGPVPSK